MKILLVYPDILPTVKNFLGYMHLGLSSIAACLIREGHEVKILHLIKKPNKEEVVSMAQEFDPGLIGISATTNQFELSRTLSGWLRIATPHAKIIIGGIHAVLNTDQVVECDEFDLVCRGEGELPMVHLAEKLKKGQDWHETPSTWLKLKDGSIQRNAMLPVITDLDALPYASRDLWDYKSLQMESKGAATVMFSRGCPRKCTYCCNHAISKIYLEGGEKKYFRLRSVDSTIAELLWIKKKYPFIKSFNFDDDNLFLNLKWAKEFTKKYAEVIKLPFSCNIFPSQVDNVRVDLLKHAGCNDLRIGLESGNEYIRSNILGRQTSDHEIRQGYQLCREAGINTRSFIMVGLPFETADNVLDSIKVIADENVGIAQYSIFYPYRKTILYDMCREHGFIDKSNAGKSDYLSSCILHMDNMSSSQIEMFRSYFPLISILYRLVNKFPEPLRKTFRKLLDSIWRNKYLHYILNPITLIFPTIKAILPDVIKSRLITKSN